MLERIEILVEEPSVAEVLYGLLPNILPEGWQLGVNCFVRPHEGKQDLQRSLPRKLRNAAKKDIKVGVIILQDQDSSNCVELKQKLVDMCDNALAQLPRIPYKVRIVCHELEAWYLGDMEALELTFPRFHAVHYKNKKIFRNPDRCQNPKRELKRIVGDYSQISAAREMATHMKVDTNKSDSFNCFIRSLLQMVV